LGAAPESSGECPQGFNGHRLGCWTTGHGSGERTASWRPGRGVLAAFLAKRLLPIGAGAR
jgi:hypothetical protein